jgi:hypothetical protein
VRQIRDRRSTAIGAVTSSRFRQHPIEASGDVLGLTAALLPPSGRRSRRSARIPIERIPEGEGERQTLSVGFHRHDPIPRLVGLSCELPELGDGKLEARVPRPSRTDAENALAEGEPLTTPEREDEQTDEKEPDHGDEDREVPGNVLSGLRVRGENAEDHTVEDEDERGHDRVSPGRREDSFMLSLLVPPEPTQSFGWSLQSCHRF